MRDEEKPDNAVYMVERAGMEKHWKAKDVSIAGTTIKMTARGCRKLAMTTVLIAVMLCQSIIQCYRFYGGGAYKSMSWSTSSRERAKLGRLDSEPPLLLREWPPKIGRRDKGEARGQDQYRQTGGGKAEERESRQANTAVEEKGRGAENKRQKREKETAEFTHLSLLDFKHF